MHLQPVHMWPPPPCLDSADGGCQVVEVWREELLEATLEIDASLKVKRWRVELRKDSELDIAMLGCWVACLGGSSARAFLRPLPPASPLLPCTATPQVRSMDAEACLLFGMTREAAKAKSVLALLKPQGERGMGIVVGDWQMAGMRASCRHLSS